MQLKEYLEKNDITAKAFANALGISCTSFYSYVQGRKNMRLKVAYSIETATFGAVTCQDLARGMQGKEKKVIEK